MPLLEGAIRTAVKSAADAVKAAAKTAPAPPRTERSRPPVARAGESAAPPPPSGGSTAPAGGGSTAPAGDRGAPSTPERLLATPTPTERALGGPSREAVLTAAPSPLSAFAPAPLFAFRQQPIDEQETGDAPPSVDEAIAGLDATLERRDAGHPMGDEMLAADVARAREDLRGAVRAEIDDAHAAEGATAPPSAADARRHAAPLLEQEYGDPALDTELGAAVDATVVDVAAENLDAAVARRDAEHPYTQEHYQPAVTRAREELDEAVRTEIENAHAADGGDGSPTVAETRLLALPILGRHPPDSPTGLEVRSAIDGASVDIAAENLEAAVERRDAGHPMGDEALAADVTRAREDLDAAVRTEIENAHAAAGGDEPPTVAETRWLALPILGRHLPDSPSGLEVRSAVDATRIDIAADRLDAALVREAEPHPMGDELRRAAVTSAREELRTVVRAEIENAHAATGDDGPLHPDDAWVFGASIVRRHAGDPTIAAEVEAAVDETVGEIADDFRDADFTVVIHRESGNFPDASALLESGNYDRQLLVGNGLDLDAVEAGATDFNGNPNHVVLQSALDPVVAGKDTTIDEYSIEVRLPDGVTPEAYLASLAADMDGVLGGEFEQRGTFTNQGETPEVGQIIDIDVKNIYDTSLLGFVESPFNAPVVLTRVESDHFSVQTIEWNTKEHVLHGTREWGFEDLGDGVTRFYTRGISVEDIGATSGFHIPDLEISIWPPGVRRIDHTILPSAKEGEFAYWSAWTDRVGQSVEALGGEVVEGSEVATQTDGPSGDALWASLPPEQQEDLRATQIDGLGREAARAEEARDATIERFFELPGVERLSGFRAVERARERGEPSEEIIEAMGRAVSDEEADGRVGREAQDLAREAARLDRRAGAYHDEADDWRERD